MSNEHNQIALNPQQQQAVDHYRGALLVIAGAGSGKTRVITSRIVNLLTTHNYPASSIVALTFTNKAALEMKHRIAKIIGSEHIVPFIGTFHSYSVRLLKQYAHLLEKPFISILDDEDQKQIITKILQRNNLQKQFSARQISYAISQVKNKYPYMTKPDAQMFENPFLPEIFLAYEHEKMMSHCFDFDDLLLETVRLFKRNDTFRKEYQATVKHVLIDEYQDTNVVQHEMLKLMSLQDGELAVDSICAVGDEDQSIYSWRGATITNMLNFRKDFADTTLVKIEQNYRSVQPILDAANHIIKHNAQRNAKTLWSDRPATNRIKLFTCVSEYQEADALMHLVTMARKYRPQEQIAVLYRTHTQSRVIEETLLKNTVPYKIIGGIQFYERKEIKDLLAYLNLIINPYDRVSFFRIINTPSRHLGEKFEELFHEQWQNQPFLTFIDVGKALLASAPLTTQKKEQLTAFLSLFKDLESKTSPSAILEHIINTIRYLTYLQDSYEPEDARVRIANVKELVNAVKHREQKDRVSLATFLDEVRLMQDLGKPEETTAHVLLMTLHAAKGLEFDTVILPGLEQGIFPSQRATTQEQESLEEERRLFYVGITRARERLLCIHSKFRYVYGKMVDQMPSKFLKELPKTGIESLDATYWNGPLFRQYFADWVNPLHVARVAPPSTTPTPTPPRYTAAQTVKHPAPKKAVVESRTSPESAKSAPFKKNQPVMHATYGTGIVQQVEHKGNESWHVTVKFRTETKTIISTFLSRI